MSNEAPFDARGRRRAAAILVAIFLLGASSVHAPQKRELFPFFSWNLFSFVPNTVTRFEPRVIARGGQPVAQPTSILETAVTRRPVSVATLMNVQRLARATEAGEAATIDTALIAVGHLFEPGDVVELIEVRFDPLTRYRDDSYEVVRVVGQVEVPQ